MTRKFVKLSDLAFVAIHVWAVQVVKVDDEMTIKQVFEDVTCSSLDEAFSEIERREAWLKIMGRDTAIRLQGLVETKWPNGQGTDLNEMTLGIVRA